MTSTTTANGADALETVREVIGNATAGRVFGTPIVQDGLTVLPVAKISGGGGGGNGNGPLSEGHETGGTGGGLGLSAKPLGVFVIADGKVSWRPAIDVNKIILGGQIVAATALLVVRAFLAARSRRATDA